MKKFENGIKSWRAYKKEEYTIKWVYKDKDGTYMFVVKNGYGSPYILYSDRDPKFSEYFR
jgi:hypothetical protein